MNYLNHATDFPENSWKCNPNKDSFISIGGEGKGQIRVCSEVGTNFEVGEVSLRDKKWRDEKIKDVDACGNCLYRCTYESQHPDLKGDSATLRNMAFIKAGQAGLIEWLGKRAVGREEYSPQPTIQSMEQLLQPGVSTSFADAKSQYAEQQKKIFIWRENNYSKRKLRERRDAGRVLIYRQDRIRDRIRDGYIGSLIYMMIHTPTLPLYILSKMISGETTTTTQMIYEARKRDRRWRNQYPSIYNHDAAKSKKTTQNTS
jgi:hypothetical protein